MIVLSRFEVPEADTDAFVAHAEAAIAMALDTEVPKPTLATASAAMLRTA